MKIKFKLAAFVLACGSAIAAYEVFLTPEAKAHIKKAAQSVHTNLAQIKKTIEGKQGIVVEDKELYARRAQEQWKHIGL